jgi:lysophospholipase L1-like esterase
MASGSARLKRVGQGVILSIIAVGVALTTLELLLRVYHGKLFTMASQLPQPPNRWATPRAEYHPRLGWVPRPGDFELTGQERGSVDQAGLRKSGPPVTSTKRPIVAVGDSFTFGDEVLDEETWPARLQQRLQVPVINGGVFAYGLDQAVLRATLLLEKYQPRVVLLAFIGHDVIRNEFSYYWAWKPYFELALGELTLKNVPVPRGPPPTPPLSPLRSTLSHSFLCSAVLRRLAPRWWHYGGIERKHRDGMAVALALLARLDSLVRSADADLVIIALGTNGQISGNRAAQAVIEQARAAGLNVLNLVPEVDKLLADGPANLFTSRGHYSPRLNDSVATRIAEHLGQRF